MSAIGAEVATACADVRPENTLAAMTGTRDTMAAILICFGVRKNGPDMSQFTCKSRSRAFITSISSDAIFGS
jgi:hypothetical protein